MVLVGGVGLNLQREDFTPRRLIFISAAYGPGDMIKDTKRKAWIIPSDT